MQNVLSSKSATLVHPWSRAALVLTVPLRQIWYTQSRCISKLSAINRSLREASANETKPVTKWANRKTSLAKAETNEPWEPANPDHLPPRRVVRQGEVNDRYFKERQNLPKRGPKFPISRGDRREHSQRVTNKRLLIKDHRERRMENPDVHIPKVPYTRPSAKDNGRLEYTTDSVNLSSAASTFIFGERLVTAALTSRKRKIYQLSFVEPLRHDKFADIRRLANAMSVPVVSVNKTTAKAMARMMNNNFVPGDSGDPLVNDGVFLEVSPLPQPPLQSLGPCNRSNGSFSLSLTHQSAEDIAINGTSATARFNDSEWRSPFLLWLHGVVDVRNVGAIFRTALFMGADGIILSSRGTASLNNGVLKTSTGATEYLPAYKAPEDLDSFIRSSQQNGWKFYGAVAPAPSGQPVRNALYAHDVDRSPAIDHPCVLVLGNEDEGLERRFVRTLDDKISIVGSAAGISAGVDSLNVSNAAALLSERFLARPQPKQIPKKTWI